MPLSGLARFSDGRARERMLLRPASASVTQSRSISAVTGLTRKLCKVACSCGVRCDSISRPMVVTMIMMGEVARGGVAARMRRMVSQPSIAGICQSTSTAW